MTRTSRMLLMGWLLASASLGAQPAETCEQAIREHGLRTTQRFLSGLADHEWAPDLRPTLTAAVRGETAALLELFSTH